MDWKERGFRLYRRVKPGKDFHFGGGWYMNLKGRDKMALRKMTGQRQN